MAHRTRDITDGPGRLDLILALFDNDSGGRLVTFVTPPPKFLKSAMDAGLTNLLILEAVSELPDHIDVEVSRVSHKARSRLTGRDNPDLWFIEGMAANLGNECPLYHARYNSRTRKGRITVEDPLEREVLRKLEEAAQKKG